MIALLLAIRWLLTIWCRRLAIAMLWSRLIVALMLGRVVVVMLGRRGAVTLVWGWIWTMSLSWGRIWTMSLSWRLLAAAILIPCVGLLATVLGRWRLLSVCALIVASLRVAATSVVTLVRHDFYASEKRVQR
jgi:hypothetical protein